MGRKKKIDEKILRVVEEEGSEEETITASQYSVKRSIIAVLLFTLGALFALGFFESAGILGEFFDRISGLALGWGKWIFPFLLFLSGVFLFRRRMSSWSDMIKLGGLFLSFLSLLGMFHFFQTGDLEKIAAEGGGGGYVGFWLAFLFGKLAGVIGGVILFISLFIIGIIAAFNFSLLCVSDVFVSWFRRGEGDKDASKEAESPLGSESNLQGVLENERDTHSQTKAPTDSEKLEQENIKRIRFSDDEDGVLKKEEFASVPAYFFSGDRKPLVVAPRRSRKNQYSWRLPTLDLIETSDESGFGGDIEECAEIIRKKFEDFNILVTHHDTMVGPTVTQYMFSPASDVKLSRIMTLGNDLALALAAPSVRIQAPIPGRSLIGIEVPNKLQAIVRLRNILESSAFKKRTSPLTIVLGKDVQGEYSVADLGKMPHILVAGTTRSGKSVFINSLILSLLYQNSPDELQFILIDPKRVELSLYNGIPHLVTSVIVEPKKVVNALRSMTVEMERRYKLLEQIGSRDIESYHARCARGDKRTVDMPGGGQREEELPKLPYIVIVIDEMADLMMAHGREVESVIVRLAQMARAVGIHLVLATQRPSVEVITGLIKANIVSRVAFQVATQIDSRTILDQGGAEKLVGSGDMLFTTAGLSQPVRIQGPFVSEDEVRNVVQFICEQKIALGIEEPSEKDISDAKPDGFEREFSIPTSSRSGGDLEAAPVGGEKDDFFHPEKLSDGMVFSLDDTEESFNECDPRYEEAKQIVLQSKQASTSFLQRRMGLGYSRAAKIIDSLENNGVIGPKDGSKPREILLSSSDVSHFTPSSSTVPMSSFDSQEKADLLAEEDDKWRL